MRDLGMTLLITVWNWGVGGGTGFLRHCRNVGPLCMSVEKHLCATKHLSFKLQRIQFPEHIRIFQDVHRICIAELRPSSMKAIGIWQLCCLCPMAVSVQMYREQSTFHCLKHFRRRKQRLKYAVHILIARLESCIV